MDINQIDMNDLREVGSCVVGFAPELEIIVVTFLYHDGKTEMGTEQTPSLSLKQVQAEDLAQKLLSVLSSLQAHLALRGTSTPQ